MQFEIIVGHKQAHRTVNFEELRRLILGGAVFDDIKLLERNKTSTGAQILQRYTRPDND